MKGRREREKKTDCMNLAPILKSEESFLLKEIWMNAEDLTFVLSSMCIKLYVEHSAIGYYRT